MTTEEIEKYIDETMDFFIMQDPKFYSIKENYNWAVDYIRATLYKKYGIKENENGKKM